MPGYDLIGDVHGCGNTLRRLLELLGYRRQGDVWRHPEGRMAVFVGDIVDRGPRIRQALHDVYAMVEAGTALLVLGNHEYNALAYCTLNEQGQPLREHNARHQRVIQETLDQFAAYPREWRNFLDWFMTLPLALDLESLRVVHACWDLPLMQAFLQRYPDARMDADFLQASARPGSFEFRVVDRCTRGTWLHLPDGRTQKSGDGFVRDRFRTSFWVDQPRTWADVLFQPDRLAPDLESRTLSAADAGNLCYYGVNEKPLFFGHYWCQGFPSVIRPNLACLDYSAVKYGRLVAYRFDGESRLDAGRFVWVEVQRDEYPPLDELRAEMTAEKIQKI
ncbi:metallophosphoesterase [Marinospirillum alkaliphilum]|uniref:Calcineurin-like phosphoesterase n=1 Tax=Marinospirillum alkaliphilum DSM 21637 TaxID=1122209 RepID=A0A1K1VGH9_9GAMM|nr:metallophosphoesterase [Marinospirillum alkaliphilum]SFX24254.1 Calcineurin-like phosphoesterase [Marinospirillum alkaliphilum DSM 21637]